MESTSEVDSISLNMIRLLSIQTYELPMQTRMPFRYGIATLTALPHVVVRARVWVDGIEVEGVAAEGLAPKWFTKHPDTSTDEDIAELWQVIDAAIKHALQLGEAGSVFAWWQRLYAAQREWAAGQLPLLLWAFGVSLVERAVIDAFCRARQITFAEALATNAFGIQLGAIHPELREMQPSQWLPRQSLRRIIARHTVGLSDPLTDAEIPATERVDDGLPQSLEACIQAYGLTHFKIKLCGNLAQDRERLIQVAQVIERHCAEYAFTLDGNEQFGNVPAFVETWRTLQAEPQLTTFMRHLIFVEQPLHRDVALTEATGAALLTWADRPTIIIDESDGELDSLRIALHSGYAGTSHKNCKGIFKGVANACYASYVSGQSPDPHVIISGEDLCNIGPVALLQDLAVMAAIGITHVERNGHHYFKGLSMWPKAVQAAALARHGDVYRRHTIGFPTVDIREGAIDIGHLVDAPFGTRLRPDEVVRELKERAPKERVPKERAPEVAITR